MRRLTVLITNHILARRTGTELVVRDLALGLKARGHTPVVFSPQLGPLASELLAQTVPVVDDLCKVAVRPDVVHGHHTFETALAMVRFPGVPAVFVCHDWSAWHDSPPRTRLVRQYLAVDETCRDRLICRERVPAAAVRVLPNAVDLNRFRPRGPLPPAPRRALLFSNEARADNILHAVCSGCQQAGLPLETIGAGAGHGSAAPETRLGDFDIVFAKARCALEAMAVGAAVVLCDVFGFGGMVTTGNVDALRRLNFGRRALVGTPVTERVAEAIREYDAADAAAVSHRIRATAGLDQWLNEIIDVYRLISATPATKADLDSLAEFAARLLQRALPYSRQNRARSAARAAQLASERAAVAAEKDARAAEQAEYIAHMVEADAENKRAANAVRAAEARSAALAVELAELRNASIVRLRERLRQVPFVDDFWDAAKRRKSA
jgi:hypothetical protein